MLKNCQKHFSRELSDGELTDWTGFMKLFSLAELRYAFDTWNQNGEYFPHMRDIGALCKAHRVSLSPQPECDDECKARHGRGYHTNDVKWVFKQYVNEVAANGQRTPWDFFAEVDRKRENGPPSWRTL